MEQNYTFADLMTRHQRRLYRYIFSLLGNADASWDVLQETNRVLLEKQNDFELGTSFVNWALTVAHFQTRAWLRDQKRDRLVVTPEIIDQLAEQAQLELISSDTKRDALRHCLNQLSREHRDLMYRRYARSEKLSALSGEAGRSINALKQLFFRLRGTLLECISYRLQED